MPPGFFCQSALSASLEIIAIYFIGIQKLKSSVKLLAFSSVYFQGTSHSFPLLFAHRNIISGLCFQNFCVIPIDRNISNELECVHVCFIIFRKIGCHLQRTVHRYIQCQLFYQSCMNLFFFFGSNH